MTYQEFVQFKQWRDNTIYYALECYIHSYWNYLSELLAK